MNKLCVSLVMLLSTVQATQIYIKNWSTLPVNVSQSIAPESSGNKIIETDLIIQPGQSLPLNVMENGIEYKNFNEITVNFDINGHKKTETIFFPDEKTQEASLSFSESGYKRFPFNIIGKK